jgi:hypothetical protein
MKLNAELNKAKAEKDIKIMELELSLMKEREKLRESLKQQDFLQKDNINLRIKLNKEKIDLLDVNKFMYELSENHMKQGIQLQEKVEESDLRQTQIVALLSTIDYLKAKNGVVPIEEHQDSVIEYQKAIESKDFIIRNLENQIQRMEESSKKISIRRIQSTHHSMTPYASITMNSQSDTMVKEQNTATNQGRIISSKPPLRPLRGQSQKQTRNKEQAKKISNAANTILPINPANINRTNLERLQLSEKFQKRRLDSKKRGRFGSHGYDSSIP